MTVDASSPQSRFTVPAGSVTTATNNYMTYNVLDERLENCCSSSRPTPETGKAVKIANTAFALYKLDDKGNKTRICMIDPASGSATEKTDVFYTDADSLMKTPEKLPLGRYLINEELQGPEGYFNDSAYSVGLKSESRPCLAGCGQCYQRHGRVYRQNTAITKHSVSLPFRKLGVF